MSGANMFFNVITFIFLTLTLIIGLVFVMVAIDSMDPPVFAPQPTLEIPPMIIPPTFTPTLTPTIDPYYTPPVATSTPEALPTSEDESAGDTMQEGGDAMPTDDMPAGDEATPTPEAP